MTPQSSNNPPEPAKAPESPAISARDALRIALGGGLMGLANLVPGLSGGTMLVAIGIYTRVIDAIADATRLKLTKPTLITLAILMLSAGVAIGGLAWLISLGLAEARWAMYAGFIGLTWGGAPLLLKLLKPCSPGAMVGVVAGIATMLGLVWIQSSGSGNGSGAGGPVLLGVAGAAGASAMILPGVSGAYLLLLLGQYDTIIAAIKDAVRAASKADVSGVLDQLGVIVPVGVGVVVGIVVVSNLLRILIHRFEKPTYGVLLGLLLAAPVGIYPFQRGVPPVVGETFEDEIVTEATVEQYAEAEFAKDWRMETFTPTPVQIAAALGLIGLGFGATLALSKLDRNKDEAQPSEEPESA